MNQPAEVWIRKPRTIPNHIAYAHQLGRGLLTFEQIDELVKAINTAYVQNKQNKAYLAQHQARAEMNRIFGYGNWDVIESDPVFLYETTEPGAGNKANTMYYVVGYRAQVTVSIRDLWGMPVATLTGTHAEENVKLPNRGEAHAMAITSVMSYALRRALINLGDRFGLGLYNGGSTAAHGQYTIQQQPGLLFDWAHPDGNVQPSAQAAAANLPPVITHETIQAEPVISDDGTIPEQQAPVQQQPSAQAVVGQIVQAVADNPGNPGDPFAQQQQQGYQPPVQQQTQPTPQGNGTIADLQQAAQQQAYARQQYTQQQYQVDPAMASRLQQGFKQDGQ
ncbi:DNA recombinase [Microbacterium phage Fizzles]|nr:DNA recombinase [Microbacterium phage Fizzles]